MEASNSEINNEDKNHINKREFTTLQKRKEMLDYIKNNKTNNTSAGFYFNIPTIEYWVKTEDKIKEDPKDKNRSTHNWPKIKIEKYEEEIYNWIVINRKLILPITFYSIDKKFTELNRF